MGREFPVPPGCVLPDPPVLGGVPPGLGPVGAPVLGPEVGGVPVPMRSEAVSPAKRKTATFLTI